MRENAHMLAPAFAHALREPALREHFLMNTYR